MMQHDYYKITNEFVGKAREQFGNRLVSVILYGSVARGTASEYSDIDLLVIARDLPEKRIERQKLLSGLILGFIDKYRVRVSPMLLEPADLSSTAINPLIYGILVGHKIIYDPESFWVNFLRLIRPTILENRPEYIEGKKRWKIEALI